jgi:hypothetical protein
MSDHVLETVVAVAFEHQPGMVRGEFVCPVCVTEWPCDVQRAVGEVTKA